ncbi:MAG: zinc ribbon domain-containing protein [Methanobacteriota archaeon]|nr:MAG: zinc ribbon domain-containing protein [Euryarchaeota archaeon]
MGPPTVPEPPIVSRLASTAEAGPDALRDFLEELVATSAKSGGLVVGEAEPGRYLLVMPPLAPKAMQAQIDAGLDVVLGRLGKRWPSPHVTDFGLKELYESARGRWLDRHGIEALVQDGKVGVVTIFCHDWLYAVCRQVATEHGLAVPTTFEEYLRTGRIRVTGTNAFAIDVFANAKEMAANFDSIDHLITKVLVVAELREDATLAARISGRACPKCGAFVTDRATTCASCGASIPRE